MSRQRAAFLLLASVQMSLIAAISLVAVALPAIQREFGLDELQLTLVTAGYGLTFSGPLVLGGRLGDFFGAKPAFATGMALFGLASAAGAFATGFGSLLAARLGQGAGAALAAPAALTLARALFADPDRRARALAAWGGLSASGAVAGQLLSGLVVAWLGWRWVFAPPTAAALLSLAAAPALLPRVDRAAPPHLDIPGSLLVTGGLAALTYGVLALAGESTGPATWGVAALGVVLIAGFLGVEARAPHPLMPLAFLSGRRRILALLAILAASATSAAVNLFLSLFLQQIRGLSPAQTSLYFVPMLLIVATGAVAGEWIRRFGALEVTAAGLGATAVSLLLLGWWIGATAIAALWAGLVLFPIGLGLAFSGAAVAALEDVPSHEQGLAGGVVNTAMEVGPTVGLAVLVAVSRLRAGALENAGLTAAAATAGGYASAFYTAALLFVLLLGGYLLGLRRVEGRPGAAPAATPEAGGE